MQATITRMVSQWRRTPRPLRTLSERFFSPSPLWKRHANIYRLADFSPAAARILWLVACCFQDTWCGVQTLLPHPSAPLQNSPPSLSMSLVFSQHLPSTRSSLISRQRATSAWNPLQPRKLLQELPSVVAFHTYR